MQLGSFPLLMPSAWLGSLQRNGLGVNLNKECSNMPRSVHILNQCYLKSSDWQKNEATLRRRVGQIKSTQALIVRHAMGDIQTVCGKRYYRVPEIAI